MSWDAWLTKDCGIRPCDEQSHVLGDWNYTHNTSKMIYGVLMQTNDYDTTPGPWWNLLNGMNGAEGGRYLDTIIRGLEADPQKFEAWNPENKWGSYDGLLGVLREMHKACIIEQPTIWGACG
jgi:hypothetical protein